MSYDALEVNGVLALLVKTGPKIINFTNGKDKVSPHSLTDTITGVWDTM